MLNIFYILYMCVYRLKYFIVLNENAVFDLVVRFQ